MLQKLKKRDEGFTIIEVIIVLAIAALILVVVLVAIPQLQRNQRNSARKNEASRVLTSVQNWSSNNNGAVFVAGTNSANLTQVVNDVGTLSQYTLTVTGTTPTFAVATGQQSALTSAANIRVVTGATCAANGATASDSNSRKTVMQYATETANGVQGQCVGE